MRLVRIAVVMVIVLMAIGTVSAQSGGLVVRVLDAQGPLPGAIVTLSNDKGYVKTVSLPTNVDGVVEFPILRAGTGYTFEVSFPGYGTIRKDNVRIPINEIVKEAVQLSQELTEVVKIVAERDVIDLEKVETTSKFSDEFIQDLPVPGRFYQNVLTLAPGVQDADGDGNPTVHGSRSRDFKAIVSGVSNVDPLTGQQMNQVNPNSIEEMEVVTAGASVEFGRAQGGFANIIQKQGSNEFEGLVEMIYRSDKLDGDAASGAQGSGVNKASYTWWQPSVQFSGPIVKDKLWYRLSHEYIDREDPVDVTSSVEIVTTKWSINSDQLTWQVSPRTKLAFQYQNDPLEITNLGVSSIRPPESSINYEFGGDIYSMTWTAPYSPKLLVDTTIAYQDTERKLTPTQSAPNSCFPDSTNPLSNANCLDLVNIRFSGGWNRIDLDNRQRFSLGSTANLYGGRFWGMNHRFKVGLRIENERYYRDLTVSPSLTKLFEDTGFSARGGDTGGGGTSPGGGTIPDGEEEEEEEDPELLELTSQILSARVAAPSRSISKATGTNWAFFVEDQIKPLQNLTMTIGLRLDSEALSGNGRTLVDTEAEFNTYNTFPNIENLTPQERGPIIYSHFTARGSILDLYSLVSQELGLGSFGPVGFSSGLRQDIQQLPEDLFLNNLNFSPFFSLAWDPWSSGKTKISFAAGRHYNNTLLGIPMLEQEPVTADIVIGCDGANCTTGTSRLAPNISTVSRDLRTPYQDEWVVALERELFTETLARLTYINRKYRDQFQDIDLNHVPGDYYIDSLCTNGPNTVALGSDGILDDCTGELFLPGEGDDPPGEGSETAGGLTIGARPDDVTDLYVQSPFFGEVYLVGNFNESDYEAYVIELVRRQYRGWELQGSYTWSKSVGNGEDFGQAIGDDRTLVDDEFGFQSQDQRHVVKLNATTITPWGFRLGSAITWQSGLPYSIIDRKASRDGIPPVLAYGVIPATRQRTSYPGGVRNSERNRSWWNVNMKLTKEMNLAKGMNLQLSAEVFNLLDERVYQVYNQAAESGQQINGQNEAIVTLGRRFQIGGKLTF